VVSTSSDDLLFLDWRAQKDNRSKFLVVLSTVAAILRLVICL
jgi:hypothetical protein